MVLRGAHSPWKENCSTRSQLLSQRISLCVRSFDSNLMSVWPFITPSTTHHPFFAPSISIPTNHDGEHCAVDVRGELKGHPGIVLQCVSTQSAGSVHTEGWGSAGVLASQSSNSVSRYSHVECMITIAR